MIEADEEERHADQYVGEADAHAPGVRETAFQHEPLEDQHDEHDRSHVAEGSEQGGGGREEQLHYQITMP